MKEMIDDQKKDAESDANEMIEPSQQQHPRIRELYHMDVSELIVYFEHTKTP